MSDDWGNDGSDSDGNFDVGESNHSDFAEKKIVDKHNLDLEHHY